MSGTILVVEDDQELREMMSDFLLGKGFKVLSSPDGWSCLREIVVQKPDLILMDINMPKLNGLNALDLIRVTRLTSRTPIIVMSAKNDAETIQKALDLGADDFVEKPFSYDNIASLIATQLFSLSSEELHGLLSNLRTPDANSALRQSPEGKKYVEYDTYPLLHQGVELFILLPKDLKPGQALKLSVDQWPHKLVVLARGSKTWRCVYPFAQVTEKAAA